MSFFHAKLTQELAKYNNKMFTKTKIICKQMSLHCHTLHILDLARFNV